MCGNQRAFTCTKRSIIHISTCPQAHLPTSHLPTCLHTHLPAYSLAHLPTCLHTNLHLPTCPMAVSPPREVCDRQRGQLRCKHQSVPGKSPQLDGRHAARCCCNSLCLLALIKHRLQRSRVLPLTLGDMAAGIAGKIEPPAPEVRGHPFASLMTRDGVQLSAAVRD